MKRFRWAIVLAFVLFLQFGYADSVNTLNLGLFTFRFGSDFGGGGNAAYVFAGPGINLRNGGDADAVGNWLTQPGFSPGMSLIPDVGIVDFGFSVGGVTIGGQTYHDAALFFSSITAGGFTFPAGGNASSIFTVTVPATFGLVQGEARGENGNGVFFNVNVPPGQLVLTFDYHPAANGDPAIYTFSEGRYRAEGLVTSTPEPGTIGLMAAGLASIAGLIRKKRDS
ncbi:MAG: PEP-CTERM sorting domain-containing protein [Candidatus Sulfotelmatobacter sp.]|jgi:hypothetical protein